MAYQRLSLSGYNSASLWQQIVQLQKLPVFIDAFLPLSSSPSPHLQVVDYGCSEGKNSILFFKSAFEQFRKLSSKPISVIHTDLPNNNWEEFNTTVLNDPDSYLPLGNIYYSTLGRSFYNQLVPSNSVHFGYSAFAFHYLSKKPQRLPGDKGLIHAGYVSQALADMETILRLRSQELAPNGKILFLVGGRGSQINMKMGNLYFGPLKELITQGLVSQSEFESMEMNTYAMTLQEWETMMNKFKGVLEVKHIESIKSICPFYLKYLEDGNIEQFKNNLADFVMQVLTVQIKSYFPRPDTEHKHIFNICKAWLLSAIESDPTEYFMDFTLLLLEKL